jgi:hypothetical protein
VDSKRPLQQTMATKIPLAFRRGPRTKKKAIDLVKTWHIFRGDKVRDLRRPTRCRGRDIEV